MRDPADLETLMSPYRCLAAVTAIAWLSSCSRAPLDPTLVAETKQSFDESSIAHDPLCVYVGPFPVEASVCPTCPGLTKAGFMRAHHLDGEIVRYSLTEEGEALYHPKPDAEYLALIQTRFERMGRPNDFNPSAIEDHRLCFGRTRFHSAEEALSPMTLGGNTYRSVKVVAVATDTSGLLFDPRLASTELPIPPEPKPGQPLLYPPRVLTLEYVIGDPQPTLSDMRYGAWVDEP